MVGVLMVTVRAAILCVSWLRVHSSLKIQLHLQFFRFHRYIIEDSGLSRCKTVSLVKWFPTVCPKVGST